MTELRERIARAMAVFDEFGDDIVKGKEDWYWLNPENNSFCPDKQDRERWRTRADAALAEIAAAGLVLVAVQHASDCAVHSEPAYPAGPCTCGAMLSAAPSGGGE